VLEVRLFGRPRIAVEDVVLPFHAPARSFSVLAFLLLDRGRPLARESVAFALWPDLPETEARAKLRAHLHYLISEGLPKQERPWLRADKRSVQWNPDIPVWVDVLEFERLSEDPGTFADAAEVYAGELLAGFDDEWLEAHRTRLQQRQVVLLLALIARHQEAGNHLRVIEYAQRLLGIDPWREDAIRELLLARALMGDRAGAVQIYRDFAKQLQDELGVEPMAQTVELYERIAGGRETSAPTPASAPFRERRSNLPAYITGFVGRENEISATLRALSNRRLVTLVGVGGVGKTRLAIEAAGALLDRFPDGAWFVDLAPLHDDNLIPSAICTAIGVSDRGMDALVESLRQRHLLLVMDNCEHLDGLPELVERILKFCPGVRILATSRERLGIIGETLKAVPPLPEASAVELFLRRAADAAPSFDADQPSGSDLRTVGAISARLDGIPLALEIAASRVGSMSLKTLAERIEDRLGMLSGGSRISLPRHQTLRASLEWSYGLLSPVEQRVFARMGIFVGGWTLRAATAICVDLGLGAWDIADCLSSLADKSLVFATAAQEDTRYGMLVTLRDYALERIGEDRERIARLHAEFVACVVHEGEGYDRGYAMRDSPWAKTIAAELQNVRAALTWTIRERKDAELGARIAQMLPFFAYSPSLALEMVGWCDEVLEQLGPDPAAEFEAPLQLARCCGYCRISHADAVKAGNRAVKLFRKLGDRLQNGRALFYFACALELQARERRSAPFAEAGLAIARELQDDIILPRLLNVRARAMDESEFAERSAMFHEAIQAAARVGDTVGVQSALSWLSGITYEAGDAALALRYHEQLLQMVDPDNESLQYELPTGLLTAAIYATELGKLDEALAYLRKAFAVAQRIAPPPKTYLHLFQAAAVLALANGQHELAAKLLGASDTCTQPGVVGRNWKAARMVYARALTTLREDLSEDRVDSLLAEGQAWRRDEAVAYALTVGAPALAAH
jgi:predicted ATPase/DNA-binding SARP family transcriptional activator